MTLPVLITVNGTAEPDPFGPGFAGDVGRGLQPNPWQIVANKLDGLATPPAPAFWQPIGYPAATFPMGASVAAGRAEVNRQIGLRPVGTPLILAGYSQGAIITGEVWSQDILGADGVHHDRLPDVLGIINFGDPLRCPGIANGNKVAGMPMPTELDGVTTGGIAGPKCLTADQTPDFLLSCALDGDLYACAPVGDNPWSAEAATGRVETGIYNIVQQATFLDVVAIAEDLLTPVATVEAIVNALGFFAQGTNAPHWQYGPFVPAMVAWVVERIGASAAA
ncbi:PE-PPE domain-containing protein [Mycobacterium eburneum]|nr:PE-PPE domain-containing protein [Mycobacterium eburneum]TDH46251.1 PE-PPE domain-containing protein [Mycobacterium eburneum]